MLQSQHPKHLGLDVRDPVTVRGVASPRREKGGGVSQRSGF